MSTLSDAVREAEKVCPQTMGSFTEVWDFCTNAQPTDVLMLCNTIQKLQMAIKEHLICATPGERQKLTSMLATMGLAIIPDK